MPSANEIDAAIKQQQIVFQAKLHEMGKSKSEYIDLINYWYFRSDRLNTLLRNIIDHPQCTCLNRLDNKPESFCKSCRAFKEAAAVLKRIESE